MPDGRLPLIGVEGLTCPQVRALVSTDTPAGGGGVTVPVNVGVPLLAWLPLTATEIIARVTVVVPVT